MDYCIALYCTSDWLYQQLMKIKDKDTIANRILDNYNSILIFKDCVYIDAAAIEFSKLINSALSIKGKALPLYGEIFYKEEVSDEFFFNHETLEIPATIGLNSPQTVHIIRKEFSLISWDNLKENYRKSDCKYFNLNNEEYYKSMLEDLKGFYQKASSENGFIFSVGGGWN